MQFFPKELLDAENALLKLIKTSDFNTEKEINLVRDHGLTKDFLGLNRQVAIVNSNDKTLLQVTSSI